MVALPTLDVTCEVYMQLCLRPHDMYILRTGGGKIFHCPGAEYCMLILH